MIKIGPAFPLQLKPLAIMLIAVIILFALPMMPGTQSSSMVTLAAISMVNTAMITGAGTQAGASVAVDAANPARIAIAATDYLTRTIILKISQDGGASWRAKTLSNSFNGQSFYTA